MRPKVEVEFRAANFGIKTCPDMRLLRLPHTLLQRNDNSIRRNRNDPVRDNEWSGLLVMQSMPKPRARTLTSWMCLRWWLASPAGACVVT